MFDDDNDDDFIDRSLKEHIEKFEAYLKEDKFSFFDSDVLEMVVDHYIVNGEYSKAIKASEFGLNYFPTNRLFTLRMAQAYSAKGLLKEALNILVNKELFQENLVEYYLTKASIFSQLKNSDNAIKFFKIALDLTDKEERDEIYLDIAMEHQYKGDYRAAIDVLNESVKINPRNEVALYELAFCYDFIGDFDAAIKCYNDFIDENPYSFTAWYNLGNIYSKVEDWDKALNAYSFSVAINEEFSPVYFNMGNAYLSIDKYEEAEKCFYKCLSMEGEDAYAYCFLGECYENQDKLDLARNCYNKALEVDPNLSDAWLGLGIVSDLEGNTEKGIELIQKAIAMEPTNASYYHVLASAYDKIGNLEEATFFFVKSLGLSPENDEAIKDYYTMLMNYNLRQDASELLVQSEKNPNNHFTVNLLRFHWYWNNLEKNIALGFLGLYIIEDEEKAKQLFEWFEEFTKEPQIVNLFKN